MLFAALLNRWESDLPKWEGRVIETKKGVVRLMAVSERAKQLFGDEGADAVADWIEREPRGNYQMLLFPELEKEPNSEDSSAEKAAGSFETCLPMLFPRPE